MEGARSRVAPDRDNARKRLKMLRAIVSLVRDPLGSPAMCACAELL